jgi:plastocyanin
MLKSVLIVAIVAVAMIGMIVPGVLAESDYSKIKVKDATTQILEFEKYNVIRTTLTIENNDSEKFQTYYTYLTAGDTIHYETSTSYDIDEIGNKTCPSASIDINPGLEEEYVFCFQVPKSFSNNFKLKFISFDNSFCEDMQDNQFLEGCQESSYPLGEISNPTKISYESLLKTYVDDFKNIDASVSNIELIPASENNILVMTLSISNTGNSEITGYSIDITAKNISGLEFETAYNELTYEQRRDLDCKSSFENINPGLTKTSVLCFEVPKNETAFNLVLTSDFGTSLSDCDSNYRDCNELFINIIAPEPIVASTSVATNTITTVNESGFLDTCGTMNGGQGCYTPVTTTVDFGSVVTMTNSDSAIHTFTSGTVNPFTFSSSPDGTFDSSMLMSGESFEWQADVSGEVPYYCMLHTWMTGTIIVDKSNYVAPTPVAPTPVAPTPVAPTPVAPTPESTGIALFVDQTKDPQHYINRYNNESTYKEWFDENYSQYSSIYEAVGLEEPTVVVEPTVEPTVEKPVAVEEIVTAEFIEEPVDELEVTCGAGTIENKDGICVLASSNGGGCLIATATYGSEMSTEVQQLRELRDNQLLQTASGTAFMTTFNDIYYSFSPVIADYERENPLFKEAVKLAITPMISSLSLMENAESESEVLGIGISVIMLNLGMYLGVPAVVIVGIRKRI